MSTLDVVALQRYGTTTIFGISVVHGVAEPLRYVFIVAGRVIVCGYAATVITVTPQSRLFTNSEKIYRWNYFKFFKAYNIKTYLF